MATRGRSSRKPPLKCNLLRKDYSPDPGSDRGDAFCPGTSAKLVLYAVTKARIIPIPSRVSLSSLSCSSPLRECIIDIEPNLGFMRVWFLLG